jgi:aryl-alcohol dehydrogenase-like predicted oxidoreductase
VSESDAAAPRTERNFDVVEGIEPIARDVGAPLSQFALAWVWRNRA